MANAQVLILVAGTSPVSAGDIRALVERSAVAAGFAPGPWSHDTQFARFAPTPEGGVVAVGPWAGYTTSEPIPAAGRNLAFSVYRQNFLGGPEAVRGADVGEWPFATTPVSQALRALPGVAFARLAFRGPTNAISWDRGIPAPIALPEVGTAASSGWMLGLLGVAALAWWASKGTAARRPAFAGTPEEHAALARRLYEQYVRESADFAPVSRTTYARAMQEASWMEEGPAKRELLQQMRRWPPR